MRNIWQGNAIYFCSNRFFYISFANTFSAFRKPSAFIIGIMQSENIYKFVIVIFTYHLLIRIIIACVIKVNYNYSD